MTILFDPNFQLLREDQSIRVFNILLCISQGCGVLAVLLVAIWMGSYENGFAWSEDPSREFNYHPTFMVMGMVFLYGESLLVYRVFRNERKKFTKTLHVVLHTMVLIFMVLALKAVFDNHNLNRDEEGKPSPIVNMYSVHSWVGMTVVVLFWANYIVGFISFYFPGLPVPMRQLIMPFHQLAGLLIFMFASVAVGMGIAERAAWKNSCWTQHGEMCGKQLVSNFVGVFSFLYTICVLLLVANPRWRRQPLPEEEQLHHLTSSMSHHSMQD
ncbi:hypothetical protein WR25_04898 [Diploscapter pachys]|uniref:Cytochrome b561 domain-containing protein n=1 Tax=Diploscapter pachys TaxID=2018661 RepID=A0A2A2L1N8_9BILA|nr:hypothetical protein WR25_04898 [Diploscapter pachys]